MLTLIFFCLMCVVFGKILFFAFRLSWGILRIFFSIIFLPLTIIGMFMSGFAVLAIGALIVVGLVSLVVD